MALQPGPLSGAGPSVALGPPGQAVPTQGPGAHGHSGECRTLRTRQDPESRSQEGQGDGEEEQAEDDGQVRDLQPMRLPASRVSESGGVDQDDGATVTTSDIRQKT